MTWHNSACGCLAALPMPTCFLPYIQGDSGKRLKYHLLGGGGGGAASNAAQPPANGPPVRHRWYTQVIVLLHTPPWIQANGYKPTVHMDVPTAARCMCEVFPPDAAHICVQSWSPAAGPFMLDCHARRTPLTVGALCTTPALVVCCHEANSWPLGPIVIVVDPCCVWQAPAASSGSGSQARGASGGVDSLPGHLRDLKLSGDRRESRDQVGCCCGQKQAFGQGMHRSSGRTRGSRRAGRMTSAASCEPSGAESPGA